MLTVPRLCEEGGCPALSPLPISSSLNETILWQRLFHYFVYHFWSPLFEGNDAINAIKLMDSTGKCIPNSCMWVIWGHHNQLWAKMKLTSIFAYKKAPEGQGSLRITILTLQPNNHSGKRLNKIMDGKLLFVPTMRITYPTRWTNLEFFFYLLDWV